VIELGLPVPKLLAVTYTEAAAKDLRDKLRERLARAAALVEAEALDARAGESAADALTRTLLGEALARGESLGALRQRLRLAVAQMDLAPIHTIHGFCQRALREHALEAGQPLPPRTLVTNEATLRREVATEFWRQHADDAEAVGGLLAIWKSPEALANELQELLGFDALLPELGPDPIDMPGARAALARAFDEHGESAHEQLLAGDLYAAIARPDRVEALWMELWRWRARALEADPRTDKLSDYGQAHVLTQAKKNREAPLNPLFEAIDDFVAVQRSARVAMVHRAVDYARDRLAELKRERLLVGFDDLIASWPRHWPACTATRWCARLQQQYAVALVDEFQDTDPRQWQIFQRLFATAGGEGARAVPDRRPEAGDLPLPRRRRRHLPAAQGSAGPHRLERNFRSRPLALRRPRRCSSCGGEGAFDQPGIEFEPVAAGGACLDAHFRATAGDAPALYVQQLRSAAPKAIENVRAAAARATASPRSTNCWPRRSRAATN
jgi:exodeoxyribonuclease V beta subunit